MPRTYVPIATTTLGTASATVTFSSISETYTDLILVGNFGHSQVNEGLWLRFNGDTASNYSLTTLYGNGTSAASARESNQSRAYVSYYVAPVNALSTLTICQIMNYSNTTTNKTVISRSNRTDTGSNLPGTEASVNLWRKTPEAINSITISLNAGNIISGSIFTLYGIRAA